MKILFFPSDIGGGFGHVSRCFALAEEAKNNGHICAFVLNDKKFVGRIGSNFNVSLVKTWEPFKHRLKRSISFLKDRSNNKKSLYLGISGIEFQFIRDGFVCHSAIEHTLKGYAKVVQDFKPDVLVGDTNLLVWILSRIVRIPAVQIVRYASHPDTANMVWWMDVPKGISPPNICQIFNPLMKRLGLDVIGVASDLLRGDLYIVPSIPDIEPIPCGLIDTHHVGALLMPSKEVIDNSAFSFPDRTMPLIYMTIGGGAGPVGNQKLFSSIISAMGGYPAQVVISTAAKFDWRRISYLPPNVRFFDWLPGAYMISMADLVIFHGGYGTMMEIVTSGKPSIVIPFHSEQESNGRRLERLGSAQVLKLSKEPYSTVNVKESWGEYSYVVQQSYDLSDKQLIDAVEVILSGSEFLESAKKLQYTAQGYGGVKLAMEMIESRFG
ncbi:MAG: glycosyltransferase [Syntrophotaleaceae bacterium]